jgi:phosphoglycolate phosphatase-like HAD superfamily hydrolase
LFCSYIYPSRRALFGAVAVVAVLSLPIGAGLTLAQGTDPLPSWNDGPAKQAIVDFVKTTTDKAGADFVPSEERIATFDQDGTLWVEHPIYSQVIYCLERVPAVVAKNPKLKKVEPFKTVLSGNKEAIAKLPMKDLEKILVATLTGMSVEDFKAEASKWTEAARDPRWKRPYTDLTYQPMQDVLRYLRDNDFKTYIVTGGGQDFVRVYAERVYGIPPEQVVGTAGSTKYGYAKNGKPFLTKEPKLVLNDNDAGKPEGINLMIGRRPYAAFGNSTGDRQMLEYTEAGDGRRLTMLVLHDDAAALVVVPIGILSSPIAVRFSATRANPVAATYVGSEVCAGCRRAEADLWRCSQHKHAMAHATNRSVLGDFNNTSFDHYGVRGSRGGSGMDCCTSSIPKGLKRLLG